MKITKIHLDDIKRCYCASNIKIKNDNYLILASEDPHVLCAMYSGENFSKKEIIWTDAGGCMSIIPVPEHEGEFLAVQEFYLKVTPSKAKIVWGKRTTNGWLIKDILKLPYIHRFDIYRKNGINYFIGATIATSKQDKNDWSVPGRIYVGVLPDDLNEELKVEILVDGLYRNHGYWHDIDEEGNDVGYFGSDLGIIKITPPSTIDGTWSIEHVMEGNIGEIALVDIDGDGEKEIMTIEPFHGSAIKIYHKNGHKYECVWQYDNEIEFAHALVGCQLRNRSTFVAGVRRKKAELMYVSYQDGKYSANIIEEGVGPANICVVNEDDRDLIVAANHTCNEAAVYVVEDE